MKEDFPHKKKKKQERNFLCFLFKVVVSRKLAETERLHRLLSQKCLKMEQNNIFFLLFSLLVALILFCKGVLTLTITDEKCFQSSMGQSGNIDNEIKIRTH